MASWIPPIVRSVDEEDTVIGRCSACGADLRLRHEVVVPRGSRWLDELAFACLRREHRQHAVFDITEFLEPRPGVWQVLADRTAAAGLVADIDVPNTAG